MISTNEALRMESVMQERICGENTTFGFAAWTQSVYRISWVPALDVCITGIPIFADTSGLHQANGCEMKGLPVPPAGRKVLLEGSIGMAISPPSDTSPIETAWCPSWLAPSSSKTCTISVIIKNNGPTTLEHSIQSTHVSCNSTAQPHFVCNTKPAVTHKKHTVKKKKL